MSSVTLQHLVYSGVFSENDPFFFQVSHRKFLGKVSKVGDKYVFKYGTITEETPSGFYTKFLTKNKLVSPTMITCASIYIKDRQGISFAEHAKQYTELLRLEYGVLRMAATTKGYRIEYVPKGNNMHNFVKEIGIDIYPYILIPLKSEDDLVTRLARKL